jgi:photosystem II stability/assembly factor-like uncharacterized protein
MSQNQPVPENETNEDIVYAFAAAPGFQPGERGLVFAARSSGVYRSEDGGQTWRYDLEDLGLSEPLPVTCIALSPHFERDGHLFAGAPGGIFRSTDQGQTWRALVFPSPPPTVTALAVSPGFEQDEMVFAGTMEDGVFRSTDGGQRWVSWNFGLLDLNVMCLAVSPNFAEDETLFAGTESGIFRSTNGGRAWREVDAPFGFEAVLCLGLSPNFARDGLLYAGTETQGLWGSWDAGETWRRLGEQELIDPVNALHTDGPTVTAVTSIGLWHSTDGGSTWTNRLPEWLSEREIAAALAPNGAAPGSAVLAGFIDGGVAPVQIEAE